jgi:hypothetical protein
MKKNLRAPDDVLVIVADAVSSIFASNSRLRVAVAFSGVAR